MGEISALEIIVLQPSLIDNLAELFVEIEQNGDSDFFHPHPFTRSEAEQLCHDTGHDLYYVMVFDQRILGYGMLRGWDEGYSIPSLGIYIRGEARGKGLGKLLMLHLHAAAQLRGASKIRLKVYEQNRIARCMYEQLGYVFAEREGEQLVGVHTFNYHEQ